MVPHLVTALTGPINELEQRIVEASVQGGLFELPAGPVGFAAVIEARPSFQRKPEVKHRGGAVLIGQCWSLVGALVMA